MTNRELWAVPRGGRCRTRYSSQFREDSCQRLLEIFVAVPLENGRLCMFGQSPQGFVGLHVPNGKMKLRIVTRVLFPRWHRLQHRQAYLEYQVGVSGTAYQFVASPRFHGCVELVIQTIRSAVVLRHVLEAFLAGPVQPLAFEDEDAEVAGAIRADLETFGKPIGAYDLLIAGQAMRNKLVLITANLSEFARVKALTWADWGKP